MFVAHAEPGAVQGHRRRRQGHLQRPRAERQRRPRHRARRARSAPAAEPDLPFELRQIASKYPVTLYTASGACEPCVLARQLLKQRGVPFSERQVVTDDDNDALERISGSRDVPTLMIGSQVMRGLSSEAWISYLDAAGYPRESRLPASYQYRPATPIVERREPAVARSAPPGPARSAGAGDRGTRRPGRNSLLSRRAR